jgi:hypothetical protein
VKNYSFLPLCFKNGQILMVRVRITPLLFEPILLLFDILKKKLYRAAL